MLIIRSGEPVKNGVLKEDKIVNIISCTNYGGVLQNNSAIILKNKIGKFITKTINYEQ